MDQHCYESRHIRIRIVNHGMEDLPLYHISAIEIRVKGEWKIFLEGDTSGEFFTTAGCAFANKIEAHQDAETKDWIIQLSAPHATWTATETIHISFEHSIIHRQQSYHFTKPVECAISPGFYLPASTSLKYTYPLQAHEQSITNLTGKTFRSDVTWALPFPFHFWHDHKIVGIYGVNRSTSPGTLEAVIDGAGSTRLGIYFPDTAQQAEDIVHLFKDPPRKPQTTHFSAGQSISLEEVIAVSILSENQDAWLEAVRLGKKILLEPQRLPSHTRQVTHRIVEYFKNCNLWEADALGKGYGWFLNMWTYTQSGTPQRIGPGGGCYDLGWGEGVAVETILGLIRHWRRTGRSDVLAYVDAISRGIHRFQRNPGSVEPYFDRYNGNTFSDFMGKRRIWLHSLGHIGSQLIQAYRENPDYPNESVRKIWLDVASNIARFCAQIQKEDGNIPDVVDDFNQDIYPTGKHHITARAVVCGLWVQMAQISGDSSWLDRSMQLAYAIAPEITHYQFENQMVDAIDIPQEIPDGEGACYALEGLVPLYAATGNDVVLQLCQKATAFAAVWTYFFDLPTAYKGIARGGQCCRMPDVPLLFPVGPAKAIPSLLQLWQLSGDNLYLCLADEMAAFISKYQIEAEGKAWDGGMIHALVQFSGKHWGPDLSGQVDTGITSGNCLSALEYWLQNRDDKSMSISG